jgi:hypothetical protein
MSIRFGMEFRPAGAASGGARGAGPTLRTGQYAEVRHHPWFDTSMSSMCRFFDLGDAARFAIMSNSLFPGKANEAHS